MAELMLARKADDSIETPHVQDMTAVGDADAVATVAPRSSSLMGQGWQGWAGALNDAFARKTRNSSPGFRGA